MNGKTLVLFNIALSVILYLLTGQLSFSFGYLLLYFCSYAVFYIFFHPKKSLVWNIYNLFFLIYAILVVVSHAELINDPVTDYFVHNDASDAFYPAVIDYILPCSWMELPGKTILSPAFSLYPLPALLFGVVGKVGYVLGIENLRLFLRLHSVAIGAITMAVMANILLVYRLETKKIVRLLIPFGICSYLYITSGVFSRDVHACLAYAIATYICLKPKMKYRLLAFFLTFLFSTGVRPANGLLMLVFPFAYYFNFLTKKLGPIGISILFVIAIVGIFFLGGIIGDVSEALDHYEELTSGNTGGLFMKFYSLPFPINTLIISIYMLLMPLPIGYYMGVHGSLMNLPFVLSPYLMVLAVAACCYVLFKTNINKTIKYTIIASILAFFITIYASPDLRRAFCAIPGLYMCYCLIESQCPQKVKSNIKVFGWPAVFLISLGLTMYVGLR